MDVRDKGFSKRVTVEKALNDFLGYIHHLKKENITIEEAENRILAEDIVSKRNIPHFDRAAMDGFAVQAEDTFGAAMDSPILLKIKGKINIGDKKTQKIGKKEAIRIPTGAPIPDGSNAVVMIEYTYTRGDAVEIYKAVTPYENVSRIGEDVKEGDLILKKGTLLQPQDIGMIAALGKMDVEVMKKPLISILSTGNELIDPISAKKHSPLQGEIIDVNSYTIASALRLLGCRVNNLGICKDDKNEIITLLKKGLKEADMLIASGGTSVGEKDFLPEVVNDLGKIIVHGVAIKPGMPVALSIVDEKPIILLPGFPVAALVAFYNFIPPILEKMLGGCVWQKNFVKARAERRIPSKEGIKGFVRVILKKTECGYLAEPIRTSGSGILSSMVKAHGFAIIPEESEGVEKGDEIDILLTRCLNDN